MRKHLLLAVTLGGGACALLWTGCQKPENEPEPNPCLEALANPLSFRFLENYNTPTPDTAYAGQTITFEGPEAPYTRYEWRVGNDTRVFNSRTFALYFYPKDFGNYSVRLIAHRAPNTRCFPKDDGVDTLTRVLSLVPRDFGRAPIYGKFQGSTTDAPQDTFTIRIFQAPDPFNPGYPVRLPYNFLSNLSKGCQSPYFTIGLTWRGIWFNYGRNDFNCRTEVGVGHLTTRDSIRIDYSQFKSDTGFERADRVFRGKRVRSR